LSRTVLSSYLPAFFAAGALCLIAAALVLTLDKRERQPVKTPVAAAASA
jgi:hypothetical protein